MKLIKKSEPETPAKKPAKQAATTTAVANVTGVSRKEFDALTARVDRIEKILGPSMNIEVPGLAVEEDDVMPNTRRITVDKSKCPTWTESQMIAAGAEFGLDLSAYRGQPRMIRTMLYEEMAIHGIIITTKE